ncbi:PilN domain-containing protein [Bacillus sp. USDA818B3_A]|uniref:PilN domain-containing protein n=1 Tax=Bacillus sp. USDA818B3_A TaxID=2698834 RepID=UPI00136B6AEA|nr:PilN domain-containing protein [Bacillus sp. USDA818B3_A]
MLVEINLLPQKEPKKVKLIIALSSLLLIIILVGAFYLWQINTIKSEVASLDQQIAMTKKVAENQEKTSSTAEAANSVSQLKSAIDWASDYPIQTIPVMQHLTSLLPERGFIQSFAYTEAGTIALTVQFDSAREAAYFLDDLEDSKWISEASLSSLSTSETTATSTSAGTASQTNTTSTSTTATNQTTSTNTTAGTANDTSNAATSQTTAGQTVEENETTTSGSSQNTAGTTNAVQGTAATTTITNTNTVATTNTVTGTETNVNVLPRYTGQFEIKLDKEYVKKEINKSKTDKGVTGS